MIDWDEVFKDASWFHWTGITPAISEGAANVCLEAIQAANRLGITVSCDLNYRKNLWKYGKTAHEVMPELVAGCDIILGNEEDAEKVFGIKPEGFDAAATEGEVHAASFQSVCTQLMARFPRARKVIITLRGSINANHNTWGGVLYADNRLYESRRYDITHIVDRVGGGDSFMGGLIYGLLSYPGDDQKALDFAVAASCLKHVSYDYLANDEITDPQQGIEKMTYIETARQQFGNKAANEVDELLERNAALFAGGELSEEAKDAFFTAVTKAYLECKEQAKKAYGRKK